MPSYADLQTEACYLAETAPPAMTVLANRLRARYPGSDIGMRGDNHHLNGYHRSRRWIKESRFCTNTTYSISRTAGDRTGGDSNWYTGIDITVAPEELFEMCRRLDVAIRAGKLEKITEWYGNFGGDLIVDGFDNIANRIATSDISHLKHLHASFDRGRANEDHSDVFDVLTGGDDDSMFCKFGDSGPKVKAMQLQLLMLDPACLPRFGADGGYGEETANANSRLVSGGDGRIYGPDEWATMQKLVASRFGGKGEKGDKGDQGVAGKTPISVSFGPITATVTEYATV